MHIHSSKMQGVLNSAAKGMMNNIVWLLCVFGWYVIQWLLNHFKIISPPFLATFRTFLGCTFYENSSSVL